MVELNRKFLEKRYGKDKLKELREITVMDIDINNIDSNTFKGLKVERIDLVNINIEKIDANVFEGLSNLKSLWLCDNKLKRIDSNTFKKLTNSLESLGLYGNEITEIDEKAFENLPNLKFLYLHNNKLKKIHSNTFKPLVKLGGLQLNGNEIEEIDKKLFENLSDLTWLNLNDNKLKRIESKAFNKQTILDYLYLDSNELTQLDENVFEGLSNLKLLTLDNNKLAKIDQKCFEPLKSIIILQLFNNDLKALSFYIQSTLFEYMFVIDEHKKNLEKNGFFSDWKAFLQQFVQIEEKSSQKILSLVGELVHSKYRVKSILGEGAFGKVYRVFNELESNSFDKALKTVKKGEEWDQENDEKEVDLMQRLRHENIIKYFDHFNESFLDSEYFCVVCELGENGDLKAQIKQAKMFGRKISELRILRWMIEAATGLKYLHDEKIIHRDIKPANILLTKDDVIKLADFGLSKCVEASVASTVAGSRAYMSPQIIKCILDSGTYTKKTDIWSMACVLFELIELKLAFPSGPKSDPRLMPDLNTSRFGPILKKMFEWEEINRIDAQTLLTLLIATRKKIEDAN